MSEDKNKEFLKFVVLSFAAFLEEDCYFNIKGYILREGVGEYDGTEYELDELYDYWFGNIFKPALKK